MTTGPLAPAPPPTPRLSPSRLVPMLLMIGGGAAFGILVGELIGKWLKNTGSRPDLTMADLFVIPIAWFLATLVHEGGHVVAGLRQGFRFVLMTAGPLRIGIEDGRLRIRYNDQPGMWGGLALMVPTDLERFHERCGWLVAGGPIASVLLALLSGALGAVFDSHARFYLLVLTAMSGAIAVATLIPNETGGYASDGAQLLALGRRKPVAESRALLAIVAGASLAGTRPRDYDARIVTRVGELGGPPALRLVAGMLQGLHALDRGESAEGFFAMIPEHFLEVPAGMRQGYAAWLVWYHAVVRSDAVLAAKWAAAAKGGLVDPPLRALADASLAFAQRDVGASRAAIERGLKGSSGLDPGTTFLIRDLLRSLHGRLEQPNL